MCQVYLFTPANDAVPISEVKLVDQSESPVSALLRSMDIDPDAPLVHPSPPLSMRPSSMTPEEEAERMQVQAEWNAAAAERDRERREQRRRRWVGGGLG